jgi:hypothetical protein
MRFLHSKMLAAVALVCALILAVAGAAPRAAAATDDPAALAADWDFAQAAAKPDSAALGKLLDQDFVWIDMNGKVSDLTRVLANVPRISPTGAGAPKVRWHNYGQVEVTETDTGRMHVLRVWVKRPNGWRALVYQEVQSAAAPPTATPSASKECENPCKSVGYTPKDDTERDVIAAYEGLETSAMKHDAADWDAHTGEEFIAASSYSDRLLDKATRLGELKRANMAGLAPTPLTSGQLFVFGDAVVMRSRHVPDHGKPLQVTRVWVKRDGKWVETASYQTAIQGSGS